MGEIEKYVGSVINDNKMELSYKLENIISQCYFSYKECEVDYNNKEFLKNITEDIKDIKKSLSKF